MKIYKKRILFLICIFSFTLLFFSILSVNAQIQNKAKIDTQQLSKLEQKAEQLIISIQTTLTQLRIQIVNIKIPSQITVLPSSFLPTTQSVSSGGRQTILSRIDNALIDLTTLQSHIKLHADAKDLPSLQADIQEMQQKNFPTLINQAQTIIKNNDAFIASLKKKIDEKIDLRIASLSAMRDNELAKDTKLDPSPPPTPSRQQELISEVNSKIQTLLAMKNTIDNPIIKDAVSLRTTLDTVYKSRVLTVVIPKIEFLRLAAIEKTIGIDYTAWYQDLQKRANTAKRIGKGNEISRNAIFDLLTQMSTQIQQTQQNVSSVEQTIIPSTSIFNFVTFEDTYYQSTIKPEKDRLSVQLKNGMTQLTKAKDLGQQINDALKALPTPTMTPTPTSGTVQARPTFSPTPTPSPIPTDTPIPTVVSSSNADVVVDFGSSTTVNSMSGSLHGFLAAKIPSNKPSEKEKVSKVPSDDLVTPLKIAFWRGPGDGEDWYTTYKNRLEPMNIKTELILSQFWRENKMRDKTWPKFPYQDSLHPDWSKWETMVRDLAQDVKNKDASVMFDVWNEPDITKGNDQEFTDARFFETYCRAVQIIKSIDKNALVGGPSLAFYNRGYIINFLDYANKYPGGCQVNFISWHELVDSSNISKILNHLTFARTTFLTDLVKKYKSLGIQQIQINEFGSGCTKGIEAASCTPTIGTQYKPGDILGFLYYLEKGKADYAAPACWLDTDINYLYNCDKLLDGLVTAPDAKNKARAKRATWWLYKYYADGVDTRVEANSNTTGITALASKASASNNEAQILVGSYMETPNHTINILLKNLNSLTFVKNKIHISVADLTDGKNAYDLAINESIEAIDLFNGNSTTYPLNILPHHAYLLTISSSQ